MMNKYTIGTIIGTSLLALSKPYMGSRARFKVGYLATTSITIFIEFDVVDNPIDFQGNFSGKMEQMYIDKLRNSEKFSNVDFDIWLIGQTEESCYGNAPFDFQVTIRHLLPVDNNGEPIIPEFRTFRDSDIDKISQNMIETIMITYAEENNFRHNGYMITHAEIDETSFIKVPINADTGEIYQPRKKYSYLRKR